MKKLFKFIFALLLSISFCYICSAKEVLDEQVYETGNKTIRDFVCKYNLKCTPQYEKSHDFGLIEVKFYGYNSGNYENYDDSNGEVVFFEDYKTNNGISIKSHNAFTDYDYYNNYVLENVKKSKRKIYRLYFLHGDYDKKTKHFAYNFAYLFSNTLSCPKLYCAANGDGMYITTAQEGFQGFYGTTVYPLENAGLLLRNNDKDGYQTYNEFYSSSSSSPNVPSITPKEPKVCEYNIVPEGGYYGIGLDKSTPVNIKTTIYYEPSTNTAKSYDISINNFNGLLPITSLDEENSFIFTAPGNTVQKYKLIIKPEQLKLLYSGNCLDEKSLYLYDSKEEMLAGIYGYVLTTNRAEVEENIIDVDYNYGNTKPNTEIDLNTDSTPMTCSEILQEPLLTIVKGGLTIIQIAGAIIAIVKGMLILVPAVMAHDADGLKKASKTLVTLAIILVIIIMIRPVIRIIGALLEYDTSCIL